MKKKLSQVGILMFSLLALVCGIYLVFAGIESSAISTMLFGAILVLLSTYMRWQI